MKTNSISIKEKIFNIALIFLTSAGFGFALMNQFVLNKPNNSLLTIMACLFVVAMASWKRKNESNKIDQ